MALKHSGTQPLITSRLLLRPLQVEDAPSVYRHWTSDPTVFWEPHISVEQTTSSLSFWTRQYTSPSHYQWGIACKTDNQVIGGITVIESNELQQTCEVVCNISLHHADKGYLEEALREVLRYLLHTVRYQQVLATVEAGDHTYAHTLEAAGMAQVGIRRGPGGGRSSYERLYSISLEKKR